MAQPTTRSAAPVGWTSGGRPAAQMKSSCAPFVISMKSLALMIASTSS
jgi:hypothetical protein